MILKSHIRDIPANSHIRIGLEKAPRGPGEVKWEKFFAEWVILGVKGQHFTHLRVKKGTTTAYSPERFSNASPVELLIGATYIGPWKGTIDRKKALEYDFRIRNPLAPVEHW